MANIKNIYSKIRSELDIYPAALVFLAVISHLEWFDASSILFYNDWQYRTNAAVSQMTNFGQATWLGYAEMGYPNLQMYTFLPTFIWGLVGNYDIAVKLTYLLPIAFISVLAPYYLLKYIIKDRMISFLGALLYGFSTYLLMRSTAHLPIALVNALAPLILLIFIKFLNDFSLKNIFYFALIYSLGCIYEVRIMYIVSFVLFVYFAVFFDKKKLWMNKYKILSAAILILSINLFWLLPVLFSDKQSFVTVMNRGLWGNQLFSMLYALAFFDSGWTGGAASNEIIAFPINIYDWLIPLVSFCSLLQIKKETKENKKYIIFFALILLIGLLLTKQSAEPLSGLYLWLYNNFPGFSLFRLASKFYLLLGIGYLGLFAFGIKYILSLVGGKYQKNLIFIIFTLVLLYNMIPFATKEIGGLSVNRVEQQEYKALDKMISGETSYYRTLWVPLASKWAYFDLNHPKIALWELLTDQRNAYGSRKGFDALSEIPSLLSNFTDPHLYSNIFRSSFGKNILDMMSVKYLIIPMQVPEDEDRLFPYAGDRQGYVDEFDKIADLKKTDIGAEGLTVYENTGYKPLIYSFKNLFHLDSYANLDKKYDYITGKLKEDFYFTNSAENDQNLPAVDLIDIYDDSTDGISLKLSTKQPPAKENTFYINTKGSGVYALQKNKQIILYTESKENLLFNDRKIENKSREKFIFKTIDLNPNSNESYYIPVAGQLQPLIEGEELNLGKNDGNRTIDIVYGNANIIPNASFEEGLWQEKVGDCHYYDNNSKLAMGLDASNKTDGKQSLRLEAVTHIACIATTIPISDVGEYLLSFDYLSPNAKTVGYYLHFNDSNDTSNERDISIEDGKWRTYAQELSVPEGATEASLYLYTYSTDNKTSNVNYYDNLHLAKMQKLETVGLVGGNEFEKTGVLFADENNVITYRDGTFDYKNIIPNPSFEGGPWSEEVGDCHNYDNNPVIAMNLNRTEKSDGEQSLQLEASRHIACTATSLPVKSGGTYLLNFDYQSPNASFMSYYIGFDDANKTVIKEEVATPDENWHTFSKKITVPDDTTRMSLFIYAKPGGRKTNIVNRYDNFSLVRIPDLSDTYYLVNEPATKLNEPENVSFEVINPTRKLVHIKGATTPFYLAMGESYHSQWQVQMNNQKVRRGLNEWVPWIRPDTIEKGNHFRLDGFLNGWYIDTEKLCANNPACTKNPDGSYDMELVIEFTPQRWLYLGLLLSGITLLICFGWLVYDRRKRKLNARHDPQNH